MDSDKQKRVDAGLATKESLGRAEILQDANEMFADGKITEEEFIQILNGLQDKHACRCGAACGG